ncbi:MAG: VirB3 family type IV secretion system protein [Selenomonadaceae bacterium]
MSQKEELPEGYEIPIHRSLVKPLYWMGVPRNLFIAEILFAVLGGIFMKTWTVLFVAVAAHYLFRHLGQQDPQFHQVFWQGRSHKSYYYR